MVDPKAAWAALKADAKRDKAKELLDGVGARALGPNPAHGAISRLMYVAIPTVDVGTLIAQLTEEAGVDYGVADGLSHKAWKGETTISMVDPKAAWAVLKADAKRDKANEILDRAGARALGTANRIKRKRKSNGPVRRKVRAAPPPRPPFFLAIFIPPHLLFQDAGGVVLVLGETAPRAGFLKHGAGKGPLKPGDVGEVLKVPSAGDIKLQVRRKMSPGGRPTIPRAPICPPPSFPLPGSCALYFTMVPIQTPTHTAPGARWGLWFTPIRFRRRRWWCCTRMARWMCMLPSTGPLRGSRPAI